MSVTLDWMSAIKLQLYSDGGNSGRQHSKEGKVVPMVGHCRVCV